MPPSSTPALPSRPVQALLRWGRGLPLRHASLSEGLRAACGAGTMLLLGELLHNPLFSWAAIGAFLTCLADSAGSNRARLVSMGGFAIASTLAGLFAASLAGDGHLAGLLAIMLCAGIAGFARIYGAATGLVLMLAAGVSAILADFPIVWWPWQDSHILIYFAGCTWATLLGLTVWRIHRFGPARQAVARVYAALAELTTQAASSRDEAAAATRGHVRSDIANARLVLMRIAERADTRQVYENLLIKLARADELLHTITVLGDLRLGQYQHPKAYRRIARILDGFALLLQDIARAVSTNTNDSNVEDARVALRLRQLIGRLPTLAAQQLTLPELNMESTVHQSLLAEWKRSAHPVNAASGLIAAALEHLRTAIAHLQSGSAEVRHGLRCAVAAGTTYILVHLLNLPFGYWATMATMLVMQPSIADSWTRCMERALGSIVGGVLAVLLCLFIHTPLMLALLVFPLAALAMGLRPVSYGLYSTFLTPVFVLVADVATTPQQQLSNALLRAGDNVIGVLVAIAASYLLWPRPHQANLQQHVSQLLTRNLDYVRKALQVAQTMQQGQPLSPAVRSQLALRRRDACVMTTETGILMERLSRERDQDSRQLHHARTCVALSRRLAATATHICVPQGNATVACDSNHNVDQDLDEWLGQIRILFESDTPNGDISTLLQKRPSCHELARADVVETLCLLLQAMHRPVTPTASPALPTPTT
jgi:uncharacterized membrane protein YccC